MIDLSVEIGGVKFKNPIVVGSATPTMDSTRMRHGIDGGAGAVIAKSLFGEGGKLGRKFPRPRFKLCDYREYPGYPNTLPHAFTLRSLEECSAFDYPTYMGMILRSLSFWQIGFLGLFRFGTFIGLQGLWLGPYLIEIKGYSSVQAGNMLILVAVGSIIGGPIAGRLSDQVFHSRKWVTVVGLSFYCLSLFPLTGILKVQSPVWLGIVFFIFGLFTNYGLLLFSHAKDLFPVSISGTVTSFVNFFTMTGAAIFMPLLGKVIESFPHTGNSYPAEAYHIAFLICFLGMAASLFFYAFSQKEKSPVNILSAKREATERDVI